MEWFSGLDPALQALIAGSFTWGITALGAALVFFSRSMDRRLLDAMLGFAAGVMIAASVWSLLLPAIELSRERGGNGWLPAVVGFLLGGAALRLGDRWLPHLHPGLSMDRAEGIRTQWQRATLLVMAITLHNIPEGLAIGVAFGAADSGMASASMTGAIALAVGIGLQNFPEGVAVALPLRGEGVGRFRSFWYGQLSAVVEPVAAVLGAAAVVFVRPILPYSLAFAAGAMIYVVVEELIPESQQHGNDDLATLGTMGGFAVMMLLDVSLG
ncbi:ZIP family metal transporter [Tautonia plasticadhaerens]|uniref:Zinc transporter ZupT n=1 Tax=Tautonia plasticadhaerens TaxID=2527974 RepID=A0A518GXR1_9BACT|nr:ZIP family metal transporter [Tautonia plasticadhaerens]QDV33384.1 Zinc transporter ZupT [Tautonia plasticadhaerens]